MLFGLDVELPGFWIHIGRVDPFVDGISSGNLSVECFVRGFDNFAIDLGFEGFEFGFFEDPFADQEDGEFRQRIALGFGGALVFAAVQFFVVGKRMRIGPSDVSVNESRTFAFAAMGGSAL